MRYRDMTQAQRRRFDRSAQDNGGLRNGAGEVLGGFVAEWEAEEQARLDAWRERQARETARMKADLEAEQQLDLFGEETTK